MKTLIQDVQNWYFLVVTLKDSGKNHIQLAQENLLHDFIRT